MFGVIVAFLAVELAGDFDVARRGGQVLFIRVFVDEQFGARREFLDALKELVWFSVERKEGIAHVFLFKGVSPAECACFFNECFGKGRKRISEMRVISVHIEPVRFSSVFFVG